MGHVPITEGTSGIQVLSFIDSLERHDGSESYDRGRWLYIPDFYSEYRYVLGTKGKRPLITIGINPSTAAPDKLDNTLKSVERIALHNGFDSFIMFNVYSQRTTDPNHMEKECNPLLHAENMKAFEGVLSGSGDEPVVWAAWGSVITKRPYLIDCVKDMIIIGQRQNVRWMCAGACSVNGGHPHHPLYLKKDSKLRDFDIEKYISECACGFARKENRAL